MKTNKSSKRAVEVPVMVDPIPLDDKGRKTEVRKSMEEVHEWQTLHGNKTTSALIRWLSAEGYSRSAIAKFLNIRYQHVRNVLTKELKRAPQPTPATQSTGEEGEPTTGETE